MAQLREGFTEPHELVHASDGKVLFLRRWDTAARSSTAFLVLHGITAHSGPYGGLLSKELAAAGFPVYGLDLRGHGLSDGRRGDYPSRDRLLADLGEALAFMRTQVPKTVLLGHSLGALNAVVAANAFPDRIDGLVLISAGRQLRRGVYAKPKGRALVKTLIGVSLLRGRPLIEYRRAGMTGEGDPLFNFEYSARFMSILFGAPALAVARMFREGQLDSPNLRFRRKLQVPSLVGVGDQDELFPVESTRALLDGIECDDKEFLVIPGARHAVFPEGSWRPLIAWAKRKFP
ncbi:MAG TPA: alpha/beta fold hydrolase [Thermoplasmata archaeon]|nr:alpha/beta fold hydrolase [Thermoplasmata archaeon]